MNRSISLVDLMGISLIRKEIIKNILSLDEIINLTEVCSKLKLYIQKDKIKRNMIWFLDRQKIQIKVKKEALENEEMLTLEDIEFLTQNKEEYLLNDKNCLIGEYIAIYSCINIGILIRNTIESFTKKKLQSMIENLAQGININCVARKYSTIFSFSLFPSTYNSITLRVLSYINHGNITQIVLKIDIFVSDIEKSDESNYEILKGFPKLNEIIVSDQVTENTYKSLRKNPIILEKVLSELSKRKNAKITLANTYGSHYYHVLFLRFIIKIAGIYGVEVRCRVWYMFPLTISGQNVPFSVDKTKTFIPVLKHTIAANNVFFTSKSFLFTLKNFQSFANLEKLILFFEFFDIKKGFQRMNELNSTDISLKNCKKLKTIILSFEGFEKKKENLRRETFYNNLKYLATLMPNTIERIFLFNGYDLNKDVTEHLNECMPNLKILSLKDVSLKDLDCICSFKNLQALIYDQNCLLQLPKTVNLLVINFFENQNKDYNVILDQTLLDKYSEIFSIRLFNTKGDCVFFNNILQWNVYKRIFQDNFYF